MGYATISRVQEWRLQRWIGRRQRDRLRPETVWNYEIGFKSEFMDRRVLTNVALYYMDWSDIHSPRQPGDADLRPDHSERRQGALRRHRSGNPGRGDRETDVGATLSIQEAEYDEGTLPTGER
jgi:hypothetical protein